MSAPGWTDRWHLLARIDPARETSPAQTLDAPIGQLVGVGLFSERQPTSRLSGQWLEIAAGSGRKDAGHDALWAVNDLALQLASSFSAEGCWLRWCRDATEARAGSRLLDTLAFMLDRWAWYHRELMKRPEFLGAPWLTPGVCAECGGHRVAPRRACYGSSQLCVPCLGCVSTEDVDGTEWAADMAAIRAEDAKRLARR